PSPTTRRSRQPCSTAFCITLTSCRSVAKAIGSRTSAKPATARLGLGLLPNNPSTPGGQIYFGASADKGVSFQPALTAYAASVIFIPIPGVQWCGNARSAAAPCAHRTDQRRELSTQGQA